MALRLADRLPPLPETLGDIFSADASFRSLFRDTCVRVDQDVGGLAQVPGESMGLAKTLDRRPAPSSAAARILLTPAQPAMAAKDGA